jgi:hypothetical protein
MSKPQHTQAVDRGTPSRAQQRASDGRQTIHNARKGGRSRQTCQHACGLHTSAMRECLVDRVKPAVCCWSPRASLVEAAGRCGRRPARARPAHADDGEKESARSLPPRCAGRRHRLPRLGLHWQQAPRRAGAARTGTRLAPGCIARQARTPGRRRGAGQAGVGMRARQACLPTAVLFSVQGQRRERKMQGKCACKTQHNTPPQVRPTAPFQPRHSLAEALRERCGGGRPEGDCGRRVCLQRRGTRIGRLGRHGATQHGAQAELIELQVRGAGTVAHLRKQGHT